MTSMRGRIILCLTVLLAVAAAVPGSAEQVRRVLGSEHLRILYWPEHQELAEIAEEAGIMALARLHRMLDVEPQERMDIFIVRSQAEFDELTGVRNRPSVVGRAIPSMLRVVVKPMGRQRLPDLVAHEVAHVMLDVRMGDKAHMLTRWLHEGIAQYAEGGIDANQHRIIAEAAVADELLTLDELDDAFHGGSRQIALAYAQSYTLVEYLGEISPAGGISPLLEQLSKGRDIRLALGLAFGKPVPVMEEEWLERLRYGYMTHFGLPLYEGIIGVLFIIALFISLFYVRRRSARIRRRMEQEERLREIYGTPPSGPYTPIAWVEDPEDDGGAPLMQRPADEDDNGAVSVEGTEDEDERGTPLIE